MGWLLFRLLPPRIPPMLAMVSLRGAPLSLPTFATAQFRRFFDCGRAVRCLVPLRRNCRQIVCETSFSPGRVFSV